MEVFKEFIFKERSNNILVSYIKDDADAVNKYIIDPIRNAGHQVIVWEKEPGGSANDYYEQIESITNEISCAVVVFSTLIIYEHTREKYQECVKNLFYETGFFSSVNVDTWPFLLESSIEGQSEPLFGELVDKYTKGILQSKQWVTVGNFNTLINKMERYKNSYYFGKDFFPDESINKRISIVRLTITIPIRMAALNTISLAKGMPENDLEYQKELINHLLDDVRIGVTIINFGERETLRLPSYEPYLDEGKYLFRDILKEERFNKTDFADNDAQEVFVTLKAELNVPVHDILGVVFKPFFYINNQTSKWRANHIKTILEADRLQSVHISKKDGKIVYFMLPLGERCKIDLQAMEDVEIEEYGQNCNFLFPK